MGLARPANYSIFCTGMKQNSRRDKRMNPQHLGPIRQTSWCRFGLTEKSGFESRITFFGLAEFALCECRCCICVDILCDFCLTSWIVNTHAVPRLKLLVTPLQDAFDKFKASGINARSAILSVCTSVCLSHSRSASNGQKCRQTFPRAF